MDTDNLITHARARFEHAAARKLIKEKYQARMIFAHAGGMWQAGPELLNTLAAVETPDVVICDLYQTPVRVITKELRDLVRERWQEQMTAWLLEYQDIAKNR